MKNLVFNAVTEINQTIEVFETIDENTEIFQNLESVDVLELIVELEDQLQSKFGRYIQIADENTMDPELTPFRTLSTLIDHVNDKVKHG
jgi:acyl carrier protein